MNTAGRGAGGRSGEGGKGTATPPPRRWYRARIFGTDKRRPTIRSRRRRRGRSAPPGTPGLKKWRGLRVVMLLRIRCAAMKAGLSVNRVKVKVAMGERSPHNCIICIRASRGEPPAGRRRVSHLARGELGDVGGGVNKALFLGSLGSTCPNS